MDAVSSYKSLLDLLAQTQRVLVVAHKKPDGDALGASTALYRWLTQQGKQATIFCLDAPGAAFAYLDHFYDFTHDQKVFGMAYDTVVVLDSGDLGYCGIDALMPNLPAGYRLLNIDHHVTNRHFGDFNLVVTEASSTSEILYRFFAANDQTIDAAMATSLMTGVLFDTTYFSNQGTKPESLEAVSKCVAAGARTSEIAHGLYKNKDTATLQLWGAALGRLQFNPRFNLAATYLKAEDFALANKTFGETDGISNFLGMICGEAEALLILTQIDKDHIKGSFRSVKTDVSKIAKLLGGGGHKLAAGFSLKGNIIETEKGFRIV